ncbi:hypothetical protein OXX69_009058 [Metschnikowia pulcherrima]
MKLQIFLLLFWHALISRADLLTPTEQLAAAARDTADFILPIENSDLSLISLAERDHYTLVLLTSTDEKHACASCVRLKSVLRKVAQAWISDYLFSDDLFFAEIDLINQGNAAAFNFLGLQTVPQLWLVPPSSIASKHASSRQKKYDEHGLEYFENYDILLEPHAEFKLEEGSLDEQVFKLADWLAKTVQKQIIIRQENAYAKFFATFAVTFACILLVKKRGPRQITQSVTKPKIWRILFFAYLLVLLGGFSFSMIKKVPFIAKNDNNEPIYISGGQHWQFGVEMVLVGGVYGLLGATLVSLVYLGKYEVTEFSVIKEESQKSVLVLVSAALLYLFYSVLTSMFLRKDDGYPFHLAKLF